MKTVNISYSCSIIYKVLDSIFYDPRFQISLEDLTLKNGSLKCYTSVYSSFQLPDN